MAEDWLFPNCIHPVQFNEVITESKEGPDYSAVLKKKSRCHHYLHASGHST